VFHILNSIGLGTREVAMAENYVFNSAILLLQGQFFCEQCVTLNRLDTQMFTIWTKHGKTGNTEELVVGS
jgi:hypothetical protein